MKGFVDFLSHAIKRNTFRPGDMAFPLVVSPRTEYQHTSRRNGIEETVGGFVIVAETIISQQNEGMLFSKEDLLYGFLLR